MIEPIAYKDESAKKFVKKFVDQVFELQQLIETYKKLFEDKEFVDLMAESASSVFGCFQVVLHKQLLLEISKITDPATVHNNHKKENFTVANLVESIEWPKCEQEQLDFLEEETKKISDSNKVSRNKLLAHSDKQAVLENRPIDGFPEGEIEGFLKTLQSICDITHKVCFGEIVGEMWMGKQGDTISLKRTLRDARAFKQLLFESKGEELAKLISYLKPL